MSFFDAAVGERRSARAARQGFAPSLILGLASVALCKVGGQRGAGDLRRCGFVWFCAALMIPVMVLLFRSRCGGDWEVLQTVGICLIAMRAASHWTRGFLMAGRP